MKVSVYGRVTVHSLYTNTCTEYQCVQTQQRHSLWTNTCSEGKCLSHYLLTNTFSKGQCDIGYSRQTKTCSECQCAIGHSLQINTCSGGQCVIPYSADQHQDTACKGQSVSQSFEPSQPQGIVSGLKTNLTLSITYSAHKSSNHKFSKIYQISPDTNLSKTVSADQHLDTACKESQCVPLVS